MLCVTASTTFLFVNLGNYCPFNFFVVSPNYISVNKTLQEEKLHLFDLSYNTASQGYNWLVQKLTSKGRNRYLASIEIYICTFLHPINLNLNRKLT